MRLSAEISDITLLILLTFNAEVQKVQVVLETGRLSSCKLRRIRYMVYVTHKFLFYNFSYPISLLHGEAASSSGCGSGKVTF